MAEQPTVRQPEQIQTPEKSVEELYLDALEKKRDTLLAFHTMNSFRKGKSPEDMTPEQIEQYNVLREDWRTKKESSFSVFESLSEDKQEELAAMGSRLYDVQAELTLLNKPKKMSSTKIAETPVSEITNQGTPVSEIEKTASQAEEAKKDKKMAEQPKAEQATPESSTAEKPESALSLSDVDDQIMRLEKSSPPPLLAIEAWKAKKAELVERGEAEANPDQTPPKGFLQRVIDSYNRTKDVIRGANRISGGSETVEDRMSPLGLRKEAMESLSPGELTEPSQPEATQPRSAQPEATIQQSEKAATSEPRPPRRDESRLGQEREPKKASKWGWLKERAKGVWNFGIWEFHQAERFKSKTKEVANDAEALATLIQQERNLSLEEAQTEAQEIKKELKKQNIDGIGTAEFYQANSDIISERKRKENDDEIEYIIKSAGNDLVEKLAKYRGEAGQDVSTRENQLAFEADLRGELNKMRDGAMRKDFVNFAKLMRRNLDEKWKRRYVWGAAEAALGFIGVKFLVLKWEAIQAAKLLAAEKAVAGGAEAGIAAAQESLTGHLQQSIWQDLANSGVSTEQLPELTDQVLKSNNLSDRILEGVKGGLDAWRLPQNFTVDYSSISQKLVELGADVSKLGIR